ncbi:MAG: hypothetical protein EOM59_01510 [Clostridia bacterium]|nr:hypothetical protein [Clostridia bacterium]
MSKLIVTKEFWDVFPDAEIAVIVATEVNNKVANIGIASNLKLANEEAKKFLTAEVFSDNKVISVWRDAYQQFKTKKGVRSSIENLLKRVEKNNPVGKINPLVDIYNTISLSYAIPCGGEDIDTIKGNMLLTKADGGEPFLALGDETEDSALPGEIVYKDDLGIVCRCWNWRDGMRTMLTESTTSAVLVIESVDRSRHDDFVEAASKLASQIEEYLEGNTKIYFLNSTNNEALLK